MAFHCALTTAPPQQQTGMGTRSCRRTIRDHGPLALSWTTGTMSKRNSRKRDSSCQINRAQHTPNTEDSIEEGRTGSHRMLEIVPRADHTPRVLGTTAQNPTLGDDKRLRQAGRRGSRPSETRSQRSWGGEETMRSDQGAERSRCRRTNNRSCAARALDFDGARGGVLFLVC